jgi:hypothetical protein
MDIDMQLRITRKFRGSITRFLRDLTRGACSPLVVLAGRKNWVMLPIPMYP